jgi:hypothetical protein
VSHELPLEGQALAVADLEAAYDPDRAITTDTAEGNVITSLVAGTNRHKPVLDLDLPAKLLPSSTPGHFHLFIDKEMSWETYEQLLRALADAGLIEPGYVSASQSRGYTAVRLPWIRKKTSSEYGDQP